MTKKLNVFWQTDPLTIRLTIDEHGLVHLDSIDPTPLQGGHPQAFHTSSSSLPINAVRLVGEGNTAEKTSKALIGSYLSKRLVYQSHEQSTEGNSQLFSVTTADSVTGIKITTRLTVFVGIPVMRFTTEILNQNGQEVIVNQLSSLAVGGLTGGNDKWWQNYTLRTATNSWFREVQWREQTFPDIGLDSIGIRHSTDGASGSMAAFSLSNRGSFSTGSHLPMGLLQKSDQSESWLWQVEANGSWVWEVGDYRNDLYLAAGGPTAFNHDWKQKLAPGESFTTVPAALCHVHGDINQSFGALTQYRRCIRRTHKDNEVMNVVFNDYMNCLMGDPDERKILALLPVVARCGAEVFVIDAGWYADDSGWWDDVGEWRPSKSRFPNGFKELLGAIKSQNLIPGVWLEPEVIGVRSVVASQLPEEAFFQECGQRIIERGRYQLDYRHEAVRDRMNKVIDDLVHDYGVGYFKFDYNIEVVSGTDLACSPGVGQLDHNRAYLRWVNALYDRHPELIIESCSSGAQRMDYAMLSVHSLQSTSDQEDPILYSAIAAALPTAVTPEQSSTWAYPQSEWDSEKNALTVVNSLLGRVNLSGRLDQLSEDQCDLIAYGINVYKQIRLDLRTALPLWPLGLPKWHDDWLALGMITTIGDLYLSVWRRGGPKKNRLLLPSFRGDAEVTIKLLYPPKFETSVSWDADASEVIVELPQLTCARLFHITSTRGSSPIL